MTTGTIEEKVFQRQLSKEGLQTVVNNESKGAALVSSEDLRDLFTLRSETVSDTYDSICCGDDEEKENEPKPDDSGLLKTQVDLCLMPRSSCGEMVFAEDTPSFC